MAAKLVLKRGLVKNNQSLNCHICLTCQTYTDTYVKLMPTDYVCPTFVVNMASTAVILMNLGSPDSTKVKDVRKYLHEFLMDKRVIDYPYVFRKLLVDGVITRFRAPKSARAYRSIWWPEGSPLIVLTKKLQSALQEQLDCPVEVAMRYGNPAMLSAYERLYREHKDLEEVLLVPLYPHYAMSSYETAVEYAREVHRKKKYPFSLRVLKPYYHDPTYIGALAESIKPYLEEDYDQLLFSYHGVPVRHIKKGDITGHHCLAVRGLLLGPLRCAPVLLPAPGIRDDPPRGTRPRFDPGPIHRDLSVAVGQGPVDRTVYGGGTGRPPAKGRAAAAGGLSRVCQRLSGNPRRDCHRR